MATGKAGDRKAGHLCKTRYCRKKRQGRSHFCAACNQNAYRARHPIRAAWRQIKDRAARKRREFDLPFPVFEALAIASGYKRGSGLHVDRRDATKGYTLDNIQILTAYDNIAKGNRERWLPDYVRAMLRAKGVAEASLFVNVETSEGANVETSGEDADPF